MTSSHLRTLICNKLKWSKFSLTSQHTQTICITFVQHCPNVFDIGSTLYKCYTNVLCLRELYQCLVFAWPCVDAVLTAKWDTLLM